MTGGGPAKFGDPGGVITLNFIIVICSSISYSKRKDLLLSDSGNRLIAIVGPELAL